MSRSFKKHPGYTDYSRIYTKWAKRYANKIVRKHHGVSNGKNYKKLYCSYNIRDWKWIYHNFIECSDWINLDIYDDDEREIEMYQAMNK